MQSRLLAQSLKYCFCVQSLHFHQDRPSKLIAFNQSFFASARQNVFEARPLLQRSYLRFQGFKVLCSKIDTCGWKFNIYIRVGKKGSLGPWSRVMVCCSKPSFCQNDRFAKPNLHSIVLRSKYVKLHTSILLLPCFQHFWSLLKYLQNKRDPAEIAKPNWKHSLNKLFWGKNYKSEWA